MGKYSHQFMLNAKNLTPETVATCDAFLNQLQTCEYGEASDALEYLGYKMDKYFPYDWRHPFETHAFDSFLQGTVRTSAEEAHKMIMDLCSIENGEHEDVVVSRPSREEIHLQIRDDQGREYSMGIRGSILDVEVSVAKGEGRLRYRDCRDENYVLAYNAKAEISDGDYENRGHRSFIELFHEADSEFEVGPDDANRYFVGEQFLFGIVLKKCHSYNRGKFRSAWTQPELDLFGEVVK